MSAFLESWTDWVARGLVLSSLLLLIAWALQAGLGRRLSARTAHALALLPLLPLLVPRWTSWEAPAIADQTLQSIATRAGFAQAPSGPAAELVRSEQPAYIASPAAAERTEIAPELLAARPSSLGLQGWLFLAWACGVVLLAAGFARGLMRTQKVLRHAQPLCHAEARRIHRLVPATRALRLLETDQLASPAAWGWKDRRIVLPTGLSGALDDAQLSWVLRHELAHHTRRDLPLSLLQRLVQIVWWFHPALWWWSQRIELTRECACDEQAARSLSGDRRPAATALLAVAEGPRRTAHVALALHSSTDPIRTMKTRITRLLQPRPSRLAGYATAGLCALLAAGSLLLSQSVWALDTQEPVEVEPPEEIVEEVVEEPIEPDEIVIVEVGDPDFTADQVWEEEPPAPDGFRFGEAPPAFRAQAWLLNHQNQDGSWSTGTSMNKPSGEFSTLGNTALVLLALQHRHPALPEPRWSHAVRRGLDYLRANFDSQAGRFQVENSSYRAMHDHLIATIAICRLHGHTSLPEWKTIRSKAVETIIAARNPYMAWRFSFTPDGDNCTFTTSLALQALADAARVDGTEMDLASRREALLYLKSMTDSSSGRVGYMEQGSEDPRFRERVDDYPTKYTELCTAMAVIAQDRAGVDLLDDPTTLRSLTLVATKPPVWNRTHGSVDYYYWMFGAEAVNLIGGKLAERWHGSLRAALSQHQNVDGSWPAVGAWATTGADIHATACALLAWQATRPANTGGR